MKLLSHSKIAILGLKRIGDAITGY